MERFVSFYRGPTVLAPGLCSGMVPAGVVAIGWTPRSTPPAAALAGTFRDSDALRIRETESGVRVRLTILLLATTTSLLLVTHAMSPVRLAAHAAVARVGHFDEIDAAGSQTGVFSRSFGTSAPQAPERSLVGTLEQVDDQAAEFVVKTANGQQRFVLINGATIRQGSKTIKASELASHKGERVKVRYREASGERRAEWIVVASPPSHKVKTGGN